MANQVYRYPFEKSSKNRTWIRFKQLDFELDDRNITRIKGANTPAVYLYLPGAINFSDGLSYNEKDLDFSGRVLEKAILAGAAGPVGDVGKRTAAALDFASSSFVDAIKTGKDFISGEKINASLVTKVLQRFNLENTQAGTAVRSGLRYTANPHTRSVFDQVKIRSFGFDFDMVPTNRQEAEQIEKIVKFFRLIAYPEYETSNNELTRNLVYKFPSMLKVDMFYQLNDDALDILNSNPVIEQQIEEQYGVDGIDKNNGMIRIGPRLQYSYITDIQTTLDPESTMSWHADGQPIATKLSVSITEDRTLSKAEIEKGF